MVNMKVSLRLLFFLIWLAFALGACAPAAPTPAVIKAPTGYPAAAQPQATVKAPAYPAATLPAPGNTPAAPAATQAAPAATPAAPAASTLVVKDGLGRDITIRMPPKRILSLAPSNTELLFAVGAGPQVAGRDEYSNYPEEAKKLTSIGSMQKMNAEAVVALKPDLVLAAGITAPEQIKTLEDLKLTVFTIKNPTSLDDLYANILLVGKITGNDANAATLVNQLKQRVSAVSEKIKTVKTQPRVFYEMDATDPLKPYTAGAGTFVDTLITLAGGKNVGSVLKQPWAQMSSEELLKQDPEIILLGDALYGVKVEDVTKRAGWDKLTAVKNKAVYPFNDDLTSRPGPRLVDGLEQLAKLIHPEVFK
jgi:iron complex transport system substrate-binding protein